MLAFLVKTLLLLTVYQTLVIVPSRAFWYFLGEQNHQCFPSFTNTWTLNNNQWEYKSKISISCSLYMWGETLPRIFFYIISFGSIAHFTILFQLQSCICSCIGSIFLLIIPLLLCIVWALNKCPGMRLALCIVQRPRTPHISEENLPAY